MPEDTEELALPLQGFKKKLMSFDFIYSMTDSGVNKKAAERILEKFQKYKKAWFECIDNSFVNEEQKIKYKELITSRLETLLK